MKSMLWRKVNKGLSSTLNWMTKYNKLLLPIHSAHSHIFHARLLKKQATTSLREKSFITKVLDTIPNFSFPFR